MVYLLNLLFHVFAYMSNGVYHLKLFMNGSVSLVLSVIIASGLVGDFSDLRRSYLILALIIILAMSLEKYIRNESVYFSFMDPFMNPTNFGIGMHRIVKYTKWAHFRLLFLLVLIETVILLAVAHCLTVLGIIFGKEHAFLNYCVLALIALEALLSLFLYLSACLLLLSIENFYLRWLNWLAEENLPPCVGHDVYFDQDHCLHMVFHCNENDSIEK